MGIKSPTSLSIDTLVEMLETRYNNSVPPVTTKISIEEVRVMQGRDEVIQYIKQAIKNDTNSIKA